MGHCNMMRHQHSQAGLACMGWRPKQYCALLSKSLINCFAQGSAGQRPGVSNVDTFPPDHRSLDGGCFIFPPYCMSHHACALHIAGFAQSGSDHNSANLLRNEQRWKRGAHSGQNGRASEGREGKRGREAMTTNQEHERIGW